MSSAPNLSKIRMILTDIDGVLTDGRILIDPNTFQETKGFHVHDAAGIVYWHRSGGMTGFISGRASIVMERRAGELGVREVHLGFLKKLPVWDGILERHKLDPSEVAYIGDDVLDLPLLKRAGFSAAPCDARPDIRDAVHHVTDVRGGFGVVRDVIEMILRAQGKWQDVLDGVQTL